MSRLRYLNPFRIRAAVRDIRRVMGDGGPKAIRLAGIGHPSGWVLPSSTITIEVIGRDGRVERFCPEVPVPVSLRVGVADRAKARRAADSKRQAGGHRSPGPGAAPRLSYSVSGSRRIF